MSRISVAHGVTSRCVANGVSRSMTGRLPSREVGRDAASSRTVWLYSLLCACGAGQASLVPAVAHGAPEVPTLTLHNGVCPNFDQLSGRLRAQGENLTRSYAIRLVNQGRMLQLTLETTDTDRGEHRNRPADVITVRTCEEALEWTAFTLGLLLDDRAKSSDDLVSDPFVEEPAPGAPSSDVAEIRGPTTAAVPSATTTRSEAGGSPGATSATERDQNDGRTFHPSTPVTANWMVGLGAGIDSVAPTGVGTMGSLLVALRVGPLRPMLVGSRWLPGTAETSLATQGDVQWGMWALGGGLCVDTAQTGLESTRLGGCVGSRLNRLELQSTAAARNGTKAAQWVSVDLSVLAGVDVFDQFGLEFTPTLHVSPKPSSARTGPGTLNDEPERFEGSISVTMVWRPGNDRSTGADRR